MTEIPEHLLKRSRDRRAAIGEGDDSGDAAPAAGDAPAGKAPAVAASAPVPAAAAGGPPARGGLPETPASPPPEPDPPYVTAAKTRRKAPFWAMAALGLLPVWGFMYVRALTESPEESTGPLGRGAEVYSNCASCHGSDGGGGVGYAFSNGEVLDTFPQIEDQIRYVTYGTEGYNAAGIEIYGNPDREGGVHTTGSQGVMPAFESQLEASDLIAVVCHERYTLGGAEPTSEEYAEEYEAWCSDEAPVYQAVENLEYNVTTDNAESFALPGGGSITVIPIGTTPTQGLPPNLPAGESGLG
ncbi:MAG: c-type cytochrome [Acidimicrobiia bacterium]|nr:c-type cytochrome [Acidimicrobiia bacterium]